MVAVDGARGERGPIHPCGRCTIFRTPVPPKRSHYSRYHQLFADVCDSVVTGMQFSLTRADGRKIVINEHSTLIKGCRVRDFETIRSMASLGFDFAGLHAIGDLGPKTMVGIRRIAEFAALHELPVKPVLLTKVSDPVWIAEALDQSGIRWLQLHKMWPLDDLEDLRDRLLVRGMSVKIIVLVDPTDSLACQQPDQYLDVADYVILDRAAGGTGRPLPVDSVRRALDIIDPRRSFIAGGLNSLNVGAVIRRHYPFAVDVQSALLDHAGRPDPRKMSAFRDAVRDAPHNLDTRVKRDAR